MTDASRTALTDTNFMSIIDDWPSNIIKYELVFSKEMESKRYKEQNIGLSLNYKDAIKNYDSLLKDIFWLNKTNKNSQ